MRRRSERGPFYRGIGCRSKGRCGQLSYPASHLLWDKASHLVRRWRKRVFWGYSAPIIDLSIKLLTSTSPTLVSISRQSIRPPGRTNACVLSMIWSSRERNRSSYPPDCSRGRIDASLCLSRRRNHGSLQQKSSIALCQRIRGGVRTSCNAIPTIWRNHQAKTTAVVTSRTTKKRSSHRGSRR